MIKAIIFDCFGVLTTDGWLPFKTKHFADDKKLNQAVTELNEQASTGLISHDDFARAVAKLAVISVNEVNKEIDANVANELLLTYIQQLKSKYTIGMLSNTSANWLDKLFTPKQVALFDVISLSYESGFTKPHPRAYGKIAQQLGLEVNKCVLIDDQERHCSGAREAGMQAICYQDFLQMKRELEELLAQTPSS